MALLFFWLKVGARRFIYLIRQSPVVFVGTAVILAAFFVARNDMEIMMDMRTKIAALSFFVFVSLLRSLRNHHTMPTLMLYAKSGTRNKYIRVWFFVKQALLNNLLFFILGFASLTGFLLTECFMAIAAALALSLLLSVSLMYLKNEYNSKRLNKLAVKKAGLSPAMKSMVYDYGVLESLPITVISIGLFAVVMALLIGDIGNLHELENPSIILIGILIILLIGFSGISISCINWRFHSIIYPRDFFWHIRRTLLFPGVFFGLQTMLFVFTAAFFGLPLVLKYLFCIAVMLFFSIHLAFMLMNQLIKGILFLATTVFTIWISTLPAVFLLVLAVPVLLTFFRAKNEYRERYYL